MLGGILGGIDLGRLAHHVLGDAAGLLAHPVLGSVGRFRRIGRDFRAIDGDHPDRHHPGLGAQSQDLGEHVGERLVVGCAEPGNRGVIGRVLSAHHPISDMIGAQSFNPSRGPLPAGIGVDHQRQQHVRVITGAPHPTGAAGGVKPRRIKSIHDIEHKPHQMISSQPLSHIRRQQKLLITHHRTIRTSHTSSFRAHRLRQRTSTGISQQPLFAGDQPAKDSDGSAVARSSRISGIVRSLARTS